MTDAMQSPVRPLEGRVALVTGGAGVIGRASVIALVDAGARVLASDIDEAGVTETARLAGDGHPVGVVTTLVTDLTTEAAPDTAVGATLDAFGRLDTVVHAAIVHGQGRIGDITVEQWIESDAVNVRAAMWLARAATRHLAESDIGSLVLFSSPMAALGRPRRSMYGATKGAIEAVTKHLAVELGRQGIRVNAIRPGLIGGNPPETLKATYPLGRTGQPEDIGPVVAFLASPGARFMTGAIVPVDGGITAISPAVAVFRTEAVLRREQTQPEPAPERTRWLRRFGGRRRP